jgi:hypothetical protein
MDNLLTGIPETDMQIMLRLDPETIGIFSHISKNARKIAMDPFFWELKFDYHHLPIMETQNSIGAWVAHFINVDIIVKNVNLILDIHAIESKRKVDKLNLIRMAAENSYDILKFIFPSMRIHTEDEFTNLIIELNDEYKLIWEYIVIKTGEREIIEMYSDRENIFNLMTKMMYHDLDIEILDELSNYFIMNYDAYLRAFSDDDIRIIYKRFGIRDALSS